MNEGLVYEYEAVGSVEEPPYYWYVRSLKDENGAFFTVMDYDYTFQPSQLVTEEIVNGGVILNSSILYSLDSLTNKQISKPVTIKSPNLFPFKVDPKLSETLVYEIEWRQDSLTTYNLLRNRQYLGDTSVIINGTTHDAVQFYLKESIENIQEGSLTLEYDGLEIYAKGIGLVFVQKNIQKGYSRAFRLKDRFTMQAFEERAKQSGY